MGSIHCFTGFKRRRAGNLPELTEGEPGEGGVLEGVAQCFRSLMPKPCTDEEVLRWSAGAIVRYLVEVLTKQKLEVDPKAQFRFFGVFKDGWYQLLVRVNKVLDPTTGKASVRFFLASALDLYPKPVCNDSAAIQATKGKPLVILPMSTLYRYTG